MDLQNILKCFVSIISFVMFCYQLNIATLNLMDPPTVLSQYERDATYDDMPLITVCPTNQANITRLWELGYSGYDWMLFGNAICNNIMCTSWGAHLGLTFDELKTQVFDLNKVEMLDIYQGGEFKDSPVFLPGYGFCKETKLQNYTQLMRVDNWNPNDAIVSITDRNYRSFNMPDITSHIGSKIVMKPDTMHYINVKIQERQYCKNDENPVSEADHTKCVDDKIKDEFEKNNISCIPPWLSDKNQCTQTYPEMWEFYGKFLDVFITDYVDRVTILRNMRIEDECRQSCKEMTYIVDEKGSKDSYASKAYLSFNQKVLVTEKVPNYDMFKYIIDVGSSLGLWLGLSVMGLHDLFVWAVQFINNSFIIKMIRSAVSK